MFEIIFSYYRADPDKTNMFFRKLSLSVLSEKKSKT
jgi:hypothetical protein